MNISGAAETPELQPPESINRIIRFLNDVKSKIGTGAVNPTASSFTPGGIGQQSSRFTSEITGKIGIGPLTPSALTAGPTGDAGPIAAGLASKYQISGNEIGEFNSWLSRWNARRQQTLGISDAEHAPEPLNLNLASAPHPAEPGEQLLEANSSTLSATPLFTEKSVAVNPIADKPDVLSRAWDAERSPEDQIVNQATDTIEKTPSINIPELIASITRKIWAFNLASGGLAAGLLMAQANLAPSALSLGAAASASMPMYHLANALPGAGPGFMPPGGMPFAGSTVTQFLPTPDQSFVLSRPAMPTVSLLGAASPEPPKQDMQFVQGSQSPFVTAQASQSGSVSPDWKSPIDTDSEQNRLGLSQTPQSLTWQDSPATSTSPQSTQNESPDQSTQGYDPKLASFSEQEKEPRNSDELLSSSPLPLAYPQQQSDSSLGYSPNILPNFSGGGQSFAGLLGQLGQLRDEYQQFPGLNAASAAAAQNLLSSSLLNPQGYGQPGALGLLSEGPGTPGLLSLGNQPSLSLPSLTIPASGYPGFLSPFQPQGANTPITGEQPGAFSAAYPPILQQGLNAPPTGQQGGFPGQFAAFRPQGLTAPPTGQQGGFSGQFAAFQPQGLTAPPTGQQGGFPGQFAAFQPQGQTYSATGQTAGLPGIMPPFQRKGFTNLPERQAEGYGREFAEFQPHDLTAPPVGNHGAVPGSVPPYRQHDTMSPSGDRAPAFGNFQDRKVQTSHYGQNNDFSLALGRRQSSPDADLPIASQTGAHGSPSQPRITTASQLAPAGQQGAKTVGWDRQALPLHPGDNRSESNPHSPALNLSWTNPSQITIPIGGQWSPANASMPKATPEMGLITLLAPPLTVADSDAERRGAGVSIKWSQLLAGARDIDEGGLAALRTVLPAGASAFYPAIPTDSLPTDAVNMRLAPSLLSQLVTQSYGAPTNREKDQILKAAGTLSIGAASVQPLNASIVPLNAPIFGRPSLFTPRNTSSALGALTDAGASQSKRGGTLDFLGLPVRVAPSLSGRSELSTEVALRGGHGSASTANPVKPAAFSTLQNRLFPSQRTVIAEPDRGAWSKAAPIFGLRDASPVTLLSPDARIRPQTSAHPIPQLFGNLAGQNAAESGSLSPHVSHSPFAEPLGQPEFTSRYQIHLPERIGSDGRSFPNRIINASLANQNQIASPKRLFLLDKSLAGDSYQPHNNTPSAESAIQLHMPFGISNGSVGSISQASGSTRFGVSSSAYTPNISLGSAGRGRDLKQTTHVTPNVAPASMTLPQTGTKRHRQPLAGPGEIVTIQRSTTANTNTSTNHGQATSPKQTDTFKRPTPAAEINILASEVWGLLKRRIAIESERMGSR